MAKSTEVKDDAHLPGLAPEKNTKIHRAAGVLKTLKAELTEAREKMKDAQKRLVEILREHGWKAGQVYRHGDIKVVMKDTTTVNVKIVDESAEEEADEENDGTKPVTDKDFPSPEDEPAGQDEKGPPDRLKNAKKAKEESKVPY